MKRILLPLLTAALLIAACKDDASGYYYGDDDDDDGPKKTSKGGSSSDEGPRADAAAKPDPSIVTLAPQARPACMTVDADAAYWIERDGTIAALQTTDIPSTGPKAATPVDGLRVDVGDGPCEVVRAGDELWVTSLKEGRIHALTVVKNADRTVSFGPGHVTYAGFAAPSSIALDETSVYVAEYDSGAIKRFARPASGDAGAPPAEDAGAPATTTVATEGTQAVTLRLDDASIYWLSYRTEDGASAVRKVAKTGGAATTLAKGERALERIGGALYFFDRARVRTVATDGGLATDVRDDDLAAFATDGANLYLAGGRTLSVVGADGSRELFVYASGGAPSQGETLLFAQPRRLVWATGAGVQTRAVSP